MWYTYEMKANYSLKDILIEFNSMREIYSRVDHILCPHSICVVDVSSRLERTNNGDLDFAAKDQRLTHDSVYYTIILHLNLSIDQVHIIDFYSFEANKGNAKVLYEELFKFIEFLNATGRFQIRKVTGTLSVVDAKKREWLIPFYSKAFYQESQCKFEVSTDENVYSLSEVTSQIESLAKKNLIFTVYIPTDLI